MNNLTKNQFNKNYNDEIDLRELFHAIWGKKFYIVAMTSVFALISIIYSLSLPNIYNSRAIMMPVEESSKMNGMLGQYSGMANLAGISIPSESSSKSQEAIARIRSFEFFSNHFLPQIMLEDLLAVKNWNRGNNTLIYKEADFNSELNQWVREAQPPLSKVPSSQEAYIKYKEIMSISQDKKTSFVLLSIKHESPFIAKLWVELIIDQIDEVMRNKDKQEAMKSVEFLNGLTPSINYEEIKKALSSLQHVQIKRLMMIEANDNYIFKVLDSPLAPEIKSEPKRSLIVILGTMLGMMISVLGSLVFHYSRKYS